jgi:hypothetical protein
MLRFVSIRPHRPKAKFHRAENWEEIMRNGLRGALLRPRGVPAEIAVGVTPGSQPYSGTTTANTPIADDSGSQTR